MVGFNRFNSKNEHYLNTLLISKGTSKIGKDVTATVALHDACFIYGLSKCSNSTAIVVIM